MEGQPATPPYDLRHEDMTPRSIKLWWKKPVSPNGIIQYYNVKVVEVVLGQETDGSNARLDWFDFFPFLNNVLKRPFFKVIS